MEEHTPYNDSDTIICIPGLGGHESSLASYKKLLPEYNVLFLRVVDHAEALIQLLDICKNKKKVILFCNCYGIQLALRAIEVHPEKIKQLVVVEAFFMEFHIWRIPAIYSAKALLWLLRFTDFLGFRRRRFHSIDYAKCAQYPIIFQPLFDVRWQNLTDYFSKIEDIVTFILPARVSIPTLFILAQKGYLRSRKDRERVKSIFVHSSLVEVSSKTHNIISLASEEIASLVRTWLSSF